MSSPFSKCFVWQPIWSFTNLLITFWTQCKWPAMLYLVLAEQSKAYDPCYIVQGPFINENAFGSNRLLDCIEIPSEVASVSNLCNNVSDRVKHLQRFCNWDLHLTNLSKAQIEVFNGFAFEFCILAKLANEWGNLAFLSNPGRLGKGRSVSPPRGFRSPARLRLLFAPYKGNFHRDISRHKVLIGLRLFFGTQSLTTHCRPPCEETPPHAPHTSSPTFFPWSERTSAN